MQLMCLHGQMTLSTSITNVLSELGYLIATMQMQGLNEIFLISHLS
jgi:hypothetical protein